MRLKSPYRSCTTCGEKFLHENRKAKFCSKECVEVNTAKRRDYHRQRYLARTADKRQRRVAPLVRKVAKEWQVSYDTARQYIERGTFPP
jgi:predicted nucleic acid-binding Zn ribbon protein